MLDPVLPYSSGELHISIVSETMAQSELRLMKSVKSCQMIKSANCCAAVCPASGVKVFYNME